MAEADLNADYERLDYWINKAERYREALLRIAPKDSHHGRCVVFDPDDSRQWCATCYVHHWALHIGGSESHCNCGAPYISGYGYSCGHGAHIDGDVSG